MSITALVVIESQVVSMNIVDFDSVRTVDWHLVVVGSESVSVSISVR